MKKLLSILVIFLITSFAFADTSFWGIPFGKTEKEIKQIERETESRIQSELQAFGGNDLTMSYGKKDDKIYSINFIFTVNTTPYRIKSVLDVYFLENLNCKLINGTYYNDNIIATLSIRDNSCILCVTDRKSFESAIGKF